MHAKHDGGTATSRHYWTDTQTIIILVQLPLLLARALNRLESPT